RIIITSINQSEIIMAQLSPDPLPIPPQVLQSALGPIVMRATQKDAQRRYTSASEMLADLDALLRAHGCDLDRGTAQTPAATPPTATTSTRAIGALRARPTTTNPRRRKTKRTTSSRRSTRPTTTTTLRRPTQRR